MAKGKAIDYGLLAGSLILIHMTIFLAIYYVPLVATDVSTIAQNPNDYADYELRVKGVAKDLDVNEFNLIDLGSSDFRVRVIHSGTFPEGFAAGKAVYVTGELIDPQLLTFRSTEIEIAENNESAGWIAPYAQKIFFLHTPSAWVSYLAFGIVFASSIILLIKGGKRWDEIARSSAEIGVVFCTLAILSGPVWAKPEWGVYWRWEDTKLLTTFVLWLVYLGYNALRVGVEREKVARIAAVYGIIGFVAVPLSFVSSRVWQSLHPNPVGQEGAMSLMAGLTLIVGVIALTLLFIYILRKRVEIEKFKHKIEDLKEEIEGGIA